MLHEMQVDKQPFPINTMELQQPKVLVRPHQAEATKGKNVMVGEARPDLRGKELTREVAYEKTPDVRETFKITVKASGHGGNLHIKRDQHCLPGQPSGSEVDHHRGKTLRQIGLLHFAPFMMIME
jgi:hypothetical protein